MKGNTAILIIFLVVLCGSFFFSYYNLQQVQLLRQENIMLWAKLDSLQHGITDESVAPKATPADTQPAGSTFLDFLIRTGEESVKEAVVGNAKQKIIVSSKYRLEDRYVRGKVKEPEILGNEAGQVVLDIYVGYSGDVKSAKLKSADGITDEDVIEACKKAALMTQFNYNLDMDFDDRVAGTVIYTFETKK